MQYLKPVFAWVHLGYMVLTCKHINAGRQAVNGTIFIRVDENGAILDDHTLSQNGNGTKRIIIEDLLPPDHLAIVRRCSESDKIVRNVFSGQGEMSVIWDYYPVKDERCIHLYGAAMQKNGNDKQVYQSVVNDHDLLRFIFHAPDAIIIYDDSMTINYCNEKVMTLLGFHYSDLIGKPVHDLFIKEHIDGIPLLHKNNSGMFSRIRDRVLVKRNGSIVELEVNEQILPDDRYIIMLRDNRVRKKAHNEFNQAIKSEIFEKLFIKLRLFMHGEGMLTKLNRITSFLDNTASPEDPKLFDRFNGVTEEFQKIIYPELISIGRYLEALRPNDDVTDTNGVVLPEGRSIIEAAETLKNIFDTALRTFGYQNSADRLRVIIEHQNDIHLMINSIKKTIQNTMRDIERIFICSPGDIISGTVKKFQSQTKSITIGLTDSLDGRSAIMSGSELSKVTGILIENAIEALNNYSQGRDNFDPHIDITLSVTNDKIRIEVKDNGPGIKREHHALLFNDGFTTKGPGHGFGLSYSARFIQKYGGQLTHETRPDCGACFVIELLRAYTGNE